MRAVVCPQYGPPDVLRIVELPMPTPRRDELRIRVHATTVTSGDCRVRGLRTPTGFGLLTRLALGIRRPRQPILGGELSGTVDAVGADVRRFRVGDTVVAFTDVAMGAHAEYVCMREDAAVVAAPASLPLDEAAALAFGGTTALHFLRKARLRAGERVLVHGASGAVGSAAVQLAAHLGAHVTAVCSAANAELVRGLGAEHVLDSAQGDGTQSGETYDFILDTVGTLSYGRCRGALKRGGRIALIAAGLPEMLAIPWAAVTGSKRVLAGPAFGTRDDLQQLAELTDAGAFRPVIDRRFDLTQIVDAHRYVETGRKRGNILVLMEPPRYAPPSP